jgi:hypothetical protein
MGDREMDLHGLRIVQVEPGSTIGRVYSHDDPRWETVDDHRPVLTYDSRLYVTPRQYEALVRAVQWIEARHASAALTTPA